MLKFLEFVEKLFASDMFEAPKILVIGDFNKEVGSRTTQFFVQPGFVKKPHGQTTDYGSSIDHPCNRPPQQITFCAILNTS